MSTEPRRRALEAAREFATGGEIVAVERLGSGHIHETWIGQARTARGARRFVHQRLNLAVFRSPERLMRNLERVTAHLRDKVLAAGGDPSRETLTLVPTHDGRSFLRGADGQCWRTFVYIEGARTHEATRDPRHVEAAARAWGTFQHRMQDLPAPRLEETLPGFGDTRLRFAAFVRALATDRAGRAAGVGAEIDFAGRRESLCGLLVELLERGEVPERIAHYDTKLSNVMIDDRTGEGICVVDLDTVMSGTVLYDFGDFVRSAATRAAEDARDPSTVELDLGLFERLVAAYLGAARPFLGAAEISHLVDAAAAVTFTIGLRFLTDLLEGDVYFRTTRAGQNLDRCRAQFALVAAIEREAPRLRAIVERYR